MCTPHTELWCGVPVHLNSVVTVPVGKACTIQEQMNTFRPIERDRERERERERLMKERNKVFSAF